MKNVDIAVVNELRDSLGHGKGVGLPLGAHGGESVALYDVGVIIVVHLVEIK